MVSLAFIVLRTENSWNIFGKKIIISCWVHTTQYTYSKVIDYSVPIWSNIFLEGSTISINCVCYTGQWAQNSSYTLINLRLYANRWIVNFKSRISQAWEIRFKNSESESLSPAYRNEFKNVSRQNNTSTNAACILSDISFNKNSFIIFEKHIHA